MTKFRKLFRLIKFLPQIIAGRCSRYYHGLRHRLLGLDFAVDYERDFELSSGHGYEPTPERCFRATLRHIPIPVSEISLLDIGCGKGSIIVYARKAGIVNLGGVELSQKFMSICKNNIRLLGYNNVELIQQDATTLGDALDKYNVIYMFNPFPAPVMQAFLSRVIESLERCPRKAYIVYDNPIEAYVFDEMRFAVQSSFIVPMYHRDRAINIYSWDLNS